MLEPITAILLTFVTTCAFILYITYTFFKNSNKDFTNLIVLYQTIVCTFLTIGGGIFCIYVLQNRLDIRPIVITWSTTCISFTFSFLWFNLIQNSNYRWPNKRLLHTILSLFIFTIPPIIVLYCYLHF